MKSALFIGRFQPFHNGHLDAIKQILKETDRVIIVMGSAEKNFLPENPLTASERFQMIEESLSEAKISSSKYCIIPINNINNFALWLDYVNTYVPKYEKIYTGSKLMKNYYSKRAKIVLLDKNIQINSTQIREFILKNKNIEKFVPKTVVKLLKEWKIAERLKNIEETKEIFTEHKKS